jgi:hypothetical protein
MNNPIPLQHHSYDLLLGNKNPMALRLNDAEHQNIQVGDLVEFSGHDTIMDRERFQVVGKMNHPSIASAMGTIERSGLDTRDKIQMEHAFMDVHGPQRLLTMRWLACILHRIRPLRGSALITASAGSNKTEWGRAVFGGWSGITTSARGRSMPWRDDPRTL